MPKDTETPEKVDEGTIEQLLEVKKGKPRKYVMICKGTSIITLVVYKKGSVEKYKKEAKKAGKGQIYYGIVDGQGTNFRFQLAVSDGFDKEPVKPAVLKDFLKECADLTCKPAFEIVETSAVVLDEDDPLVIKYRKLQKVAEAKAEQLKASGDDNKVKTLCRQIEGYLDEDQTDNAKDRIFDLETVLNVGQTTSTTEDLAGTYTTRMKELQPKIDKASDNKEIALLGKLAHELANRKDYAQALKALDKLADKLQYAGTVGEDKAAEMKKGVVDKRALLDSVKKWQQAKQTVDQQLTQLLASLRSSDFKTLGRIADDCEAVGTGLKQYDTALLTVIQKVNQAPSDEALKKSALAGREVIGKYEKHIQDNKLIQACENNPVNVDVAVRIELGVGLAHLDKSLAAAVESLS